MIIAQKLQYSKRAEYLLYMWQVEDLIRANACDIEQLRSNYLTQFSLTDEEMAKTEQWYAELCTMMRQEGKTEHGHLQINNNVIEGLAELHTQLIESQKFPFYRQFYYKVLPYLVELRSKSAAAAATTSSTLSAMGQELEQCFALLYGLWLLRVQKREISAETTKAAQDVSAFLGQLADYWLLQRKGELKFD